MPLIASCGSADKNAAVSPETRVADGAPTDTGTVRVYRWLEVSDDPASMAVLSCEGETAPGADIDAVERYASPAAAANGQVEAVLAECQWHTSGTHCADAAGFGDVTQAAGPSDTDGVSGFVSLNGGSIVCRWSEGALALGNLVKVREVGDNDRYRVRTCTDASVDHCGVWHTVQKADESIPAGALLP